MKLCRRDKSTVDRHIRRRHDNDPKVVIKPYLDETITVKKARECLENIASDQLKTCEQPCRMASLPSNNSAPSTRVIETGLVQSTIVATANTSNPSSCVLSLAKKKSSNSTTEMSTLLSKVDKLIKEFKELKVSPSVKYVNQPSLLLSIGKKASGDVAEIVSQWPEVKNILDLTRLCKNIRFFPGDVDQGDLSVIRCKTCFNYLKSKRIKPSDKSSPAQVAKKGIGG